MLRLPALFQDCIMEASAVIFHSPAGSCRLPRAVDLYPMSKFEKTDCRQVLHVGTILSEVCSVQFRLKLLLQPDCEPNHKKTIGQNEIEWMWGEKHLSCHLGGLLVFHFPRYKNENTLSSPIEHNWLGAAEPPQRIIHNWKCTTLKTIVAVMLGTLVLNWIKYLQGMFSEYTWTPTVWLSVEIHKDQMLSSPLSGWAE